MLWITEDDEKLQLRILFAAHTGKGGHRTTELTYEIVAAHFRGKISAKTP